MGLARYLVELIHALYYWEDRGEGEGFGNRATRQISAIRKTPARWNAYPWYLG